MNLEQMGKVSLGAYPTPLEKMARLSEKLGRGTLYIKRDDATGPAFGGNKTRKLEYVMQEALAGGYTAMLTVGGPQTNHGRTTVAAAVQLGLKPILVLGGPPPETLSGNLVLDAMMGTDLVFAGDDMEGAVAATIERYERAGDRVYFLPLGGTGYVGMLGYIMAVPELLRQIEQMGLRPSALVCAAGSLGTYCGLVLGARHFKAPFEVVGIPVSPPAADFKARAAALINDCSAHYGLAVRVDERDLRIENGPADAPYSGAAYNQPDPLTRAAMFELARSEGILLDPVYTGKAFRGMLDLLQRGELGGAGEEVIFLHTGGAVALWTREHLDAMQQDLRDNCQIRTLP
ncbi:MAG: D-cysteine desulfhydrase family protein [Clostridiales bacterium]|nr:D-cysteine desulfhydrase family protein [Clostridiales bacterium]